MNASTLTDLSIFLLKGLAILLAGGLAATAFKSWSASWLSAVWRSVFLALLALTPWLLFPGWWHVEVGRPAEPVPIAEVSASLAVSATETTGDMSPAAPLPRPKTSFQEAVILIYGLGVALCVLPWLGGRLTVWRWSRSGRLPANREWVEELSRQEPVADRRPRLCVHPQVAVPCVTGFWRPVLLLPETADSLPDDAIGTILRHELCHVRRHDGVFQFLAVLGRALHWPNPVVWWAARQLSLAAERTADDTVLASGVSGRDYGRLLASLVAPTGRWSDRAASSMARPSTLEIRVRHALDASQNRVPPSRTGRGLVAGLALGLAAAVGGVSAQAPATDSTAAPAPVLAPEDAAVQEKLKKIVVPLVSMNEVSLDLGLKYLEAMSRTHDTETKDGARRGVTFRLAEKDSQAKTTLTLELRQAPLEVLLKAVCDIAGTTYRIEKGEVLVLPPGSNKEARLLLPPERSLAPSSVLSPKLIQIVPKLALDQATLEEAVEFLYLKSRELDTAELDPEKRGMNFVLRLPPDKASKKLTLSLANVSFSQAIEAICRETGMAWKATDVAVVIHPKEDDEKKEE